MFLSGWAQPSHLYIHSIIHAELEKENTFFLFMQGKEPGPRPGSKHPYAAVVYFWKVTPTTATLTQATPSPLEFSSALYTASCTARATSVTT